MKEKPQKLTKSFVVRCLQTEQNWKVGDTKNFTFDNYELTIWREESIYAPFAFGVRAKVTFPTHQVNYVRRYLNMERAFLHILNRFNENANIIDRYKSLDQWFDERY